MIITKEAVIMLLLATLSVSVAKSTKSKRRKFERIVGGEATTIEQFPYQAALLLDGVQICGGTIINNYLIVTAAHCLDSTVVFNVSQVSVRVGSSSWRTGGQRIAAAMIFLHPQYRVGITDYDIAVISLAEFITVPNAVGIPMLNSGESFPVGTQGWATGWGLTSSGASSRPETLRRVVLPIYDQTLCQQVYGNIITSRTICAGYAAGGRDACQGDSGGPYVINGRLVGIASFGFGCGLPNFPGVYSSVAGLRDFVTQTTGI